MANKSAHFCAWQGCNNICTNKYCTEHAEAGEERDREKAKAHFQRYDKERGTATFRGYNSKWARYSKWFLSQPENKMCALRLDAGCAMIAQCVDHIDPPDNARDPRFWDYENHQPACIHCNSLKGHRKMKGEYWNDGTEDKDDKRQ